ncbi:MULTISPECIES: Hpt domain-containing protein [Croceitalea]|uniref:Hpt domain-containing protein n=1 Tax=Croceitalea vernalis TaxID=3075599 RepID=A0ABU3BFH2_9FLAO|nr:MULTISPECIES: Hpt domain-containing protein [unclassified Croceitalea]MDT0539118.1 Hpt domain-containing protein [Croceitalea sp. P059]MDT0620912.1 Hpt domain-containing protein [Croceitalea sp. P007]
MGEVPNLNYIKEIAGGNEEFEKKFLAIIQAEFPKEKEDYLKYLADNELEESAKVVHKIKHKLGILGLNNAYKLAIKHEEGLKYGDEKLNSDFEEVLNKVEEFILKIS